MNGSRQLSFNKPLTLLPKKGRFLSPPLFFEPTEMVENEDQSLFAQKVSPLQSKWDFNKDLGIIISGKEPENAQNIRLKIRLIRTSDGKKVFQEERGLGNQTTYTERFSISKNVLKEGKHRLITTIFNEADSLRRGLPFDIVWFDKPLSLWDSELAIKPLRYITEEEEYKTFD